MGKDFVMLLRNIILLCSVFSLFCDANSKQDSNTKTSNLPPLSEEFRKLPKLKETMAELQIQMAECNKQLSEKTNEYMNDISNIRTSKEEKIEGSKQLESRIVSLHNELDKLKSEIESLQNKDSNVNQIQEAKNKKSDNTEEADIDNEDSKTQNVKTTTVTEDSTTEEDVDNEDPTTQTTVVPSVAEDSKTEEDVDNEDPTIQTTVAPSVADSNVAVVQPISATLPNAEDDEYEYVYEEVPATQTAETQNTQTTVAAAVVDSNVAVAQPISATLPNAEDDEYEYVYEEVPATQTAEIATLSQ